MAKQNPDVQMLLALQDATVIADNRFTTSDGIPLRVRSIDYISDEFEINDIIKIPQNYQVLSVKINGLDGYRCIEVHVESEDGRVRKALFFPNCLAKTITPIDANGHRMEKVNTLGPVAEWYSKQGTIDHAMETLAGEELIVVDKEIYTIRDYETRKPCYAKGIGLEQDYQKAIEWYTKAAASGDIGIISKLAELHSKVSISWYEKAAELGSMEALEKLAEYYYKLGDFVKAGTLYKKLNENGRYNVILGHCYYELEYYSESVKYYNIGAQQKDVDAFIALGKCYYLGHGVPIDREKANKYFMAAIEAKKAKDDLPF